MTTPGATKYRVMYEDPKSREEERIRARVFDDRTTADDFANANTICAKPCRVEEFVDTGGAQVIDLYEALKRSLEDS